MCVIDWSVLINNCVKGLCKNIVDRLFRRETYVATRDSTSWCSRDQSTMDWKDSTLELVAWSDVFWPQTIGWIDLGK